MVLADELDYPTRGPDALKTMLIGGGLLLAGSVIGFVGGLLTLLLVGFLILPLAFVPQILTQGYLVRVLGSTVDGEADPPVWEEWADVFVDGLKFVLVSLLYSLPVVVVGVVLLAVLFATTSIGAGAGGSAGNAVAGLSVVLGLLVGLALLVLSLAVFYLLPIGLCGMAHDDAVGGAFDLDRLRAVATSREYAVAWLAGAVVFVVGGGIAQFLVFLLVGFPLLFAAQVLGFRYFARGYADALDLEVAPPDPTPSPAAPDPDPLTPDDPGRTEADGTAPPDEGAAGADDTLAGDEDSAVGAGDAPTDDTPADDPDDARRD
jgi:hypothetical protein